jgi:hypothetical protein
MASFFAAACLFIISGFRLHGLLLPHDLPLILASVVWTGMIFCSFGWQG